MNEPILVLIYRTYPSDDDDPTPKCNVFYATFLSLEERDRTVALIGHAFPEATIEDAGGARLSGPENVSIKKDVRLSRMMAQAPA